MPRRERWVRLAEVARSGLSADEVLAVMAAAILELGIAQAFTMIHGTEAGWRRYVANGGRVRFDGEGQPIFPVHALSPAELGPLRSPGGLRTFTGSCTGEGGKPRGFSPCGVSVANPARGGGPGGTPGSGDSRGLCPLKGRASVARDQAVSAIGA